MINYLRILNSKKVQNDISYLSKPAKLTLTVNIRNEGNKENQIKNECLLHYRLLSKNKETQLRAEHRMKKWRKHSNKYQLNTDCLSRKYDDF